MSTVDWNRIQQVAERVHKALCDIKPQRRSGEDAIDAGGVSIDGDDDGNVVLTDSQSAYSGSMDPPEVHIREICTIGPDGFVKDAEAGEMSYNGHQPATAVHALFNHMIREILEDVVVTDGEAALHAEMAEDHGSLD